MSNHTLDHRFCTAPMIDWSDRHCRYLWRLLTKHAVVYTEMITTGALLHGDRNRHLQFNDEEHPVAIQLGGADPAALAECSKIAEDAGYDEINLNCGCPSDRVQSGKFGACLMAEPDLVADCIDTMQKAVSIPVTVKHRIGIEDQEDYESLSQFVSVISQTGCKTFIVHARKAWLTGLSPKENREIPPLRYELVHQLKREFPTLDIIINGGFTNLTEAKKQLDVVDGVMVGREAYHNPFCLAGVDQLFFESDRSISREDVIGEFADYCNFQMQRGEKFHHMAKHILGLFHGQRGGKKFRRYLSETMHLSTANANLLLEATERVGET